MQIKSEQQKGNTVDVVFILGKDNAGEHTIQDQIKKISKDCATKKLSYFILGDGKKPVSLDDIETLPKCNSIALHAHGAVEQDAHFIDEVNSLDFLHKAQLQTQCKNILFGSCFGGKLVDDFKNNKHKQLPEGTFLLATSTPDSLSLTSEICKIFDEYIATMNPGTSPELFKFVGNVVKKVSETMVLAFQLQDKLLSETLHRKARGYDKLFIDVKKYYEYQLIKINDFIDNLLREENSKLVLERLKNEFPNYDFEDHLSKSDSKDKINLLPFSMTLEEENFFQQSALLNHVVHNDVEIIDALLEQHKFEPLLLIAAILKSSVGDFKDLSVMIDVLLKHKSNALYGMNENAFCPDATLSDYYEACLKYGFIESLGLLIYSPLTFALKENKLSIIEILLKHGVDIYLADVKGTVPAKILDNSKYQHLFIEPLKKATEIGQALDIIKPHITSETDYSLYPSLAKDIQDILNKREQFEILCKEEKDADFLELKSNLPKNSKVYKAYYDYVSSATAINTMDILRFASDSGLKNELNELVKTSSLDLSLYQSVTNNNLELVKINLYRGEKATQIYQHEITLLSYAVVMEHDNIVSELIKNGADLKATPFQIKLLEVAAAHASKNIKNCLINAKINESNSSADLNELFIHTAQYDKCFLAGSLIKWNPDINALDPYGKSALHYCALNGNFEFVRSMYWWKADFNIRDTDGYSALQLASMKSKSLQTPDSERFKYINIVKSLLKGGADFRSDPEVLLDINLSNAFFIDFNFSDTNLSGTNFSGADLKSTKFNNANLTGVNFTASKNLQVEQLFEASSIRDIIVDTEFLKKLNYRQLATLMHKASKDYETYITNGPMDEVVNKLVTIIQDKTHLLKFNAGSLLSTHSNTAFYEKVIKMGRKQLLTFLQNQDPPQELSAGLKKNLKIIFETNTGTIESNVNTFFSASKDNKSSVEELNQILQQSNRPKMH